MNDDDSADHAGRAADARHPENEAQLRAMFEAMDQGLCVAEVEFDATGRAVDYRIVQMNPAFERHTGLHGVLGKSIRECVPDLEEFWFRTYGRVAATGEPARFVSEAKPLGGRSFDVHAFRLGAADSRKVAIVFTDITAKRQADERLRRSEERFRSMADAAPAMLWVTGPDGAASFLSNGWYDYTGQVEREALGFGWLDAVHPDDRAASGRIFLDANQRRVPFQLDYRLRRADGRYRWAIDSGRPHFDTDGAYLGFIGSVIDVHERTEAEQALHHSEDRMAFVRQSTGVGYWYCDLPFDVLEWDEQVKAHFHLPADARVTIDTFYERLHPDDRERTRRSIERSIRERTLYDIDYRTVDPASGRVTWVQAIGRTYYGDDGSPIRFDGITLDVTQRKATEAALRQSELALREADARKNEFLATLAHELRNPLAPIRQAAAVGASPAATPDQVARSLQIIERQVRQMALLLDDLLDVSRISHGRIELDLATLDLRGVVEASVETSRPHIDTRRHRLDVELPDAPLAVRGDALRLAQVLSNLLTNAAKYTEPGGSIRLSARAEGEFVEVAVADKGIGIAPEQLHRVFDMFEQGPSSQLAAGGLGIGLALARGLVLLHGGTIEAQSAGEGHGSTFVVRLPRAAQAPPVAPQPTARPPRTADLARVLVVDDNRDAADSLALWLDLRGYAVRTAHDGHAALQAVATFRPQVVLLDLGMPRMDGFEVVRRLRAADDGRVAAVVALTGWGQEHDRERTRAAGFDHHLTKPVDLEALEDILRSAAKQSSARLP